MPCEVLQEVVIDVRGAIAFLEGHAAGATHFDGVSGPDGLAARTAELPEPGLRRGLRAAVASGSAADGASAVAVLLAAGFGAAGPLRRGGAEEEAGPASRRLWAPAPLLLRALPLAAGGRTALDVGAGGGRDAAFLAARGWRVIAVDRSAGLVARAERLARRVYAGDAGERGAVAGVARTLGRDRGADRAWLRAHASQLLLVVRFLRRSVLDLLPDAVLPGGVVAYEHFLRGCERFGSPRKPAQMVAPGELASVFSEERGFRVLLDVEETLADGRPVNRFIAVRRDEPG